MAFLCAACSPRAAPSRSVSPSPLASPTPQPQPAATTEPAEGFDINFAMGHVRALAVDVGVRESGTPADSTAADHIAAQLPRSWTVTKAPFPLPQGGESWNVVGTPPGFDETKPYLIVGGHYDSLVGPGANDNASGVGIALEIARAVDASPARLPVVFVAFGAEERQRRADGNPKPHHVGSRWYVAHMSGDAKRNLVAVVNVDMVGRGEAVYCGRLASGLREANDRCVQTGARTNILALERVTPDYSDHGSFSRAGMNATWLWTGEDPCCNHKPTDTFDRVQAQSVDNAGRLALAILRSYTS